MNISELAKMHISNKHGILEKVNMAECAWYALRGTLKLWTPEVSKAEPYGPLYEKKYFLSRFPYTNKLVNMHWSQSVVENYGYTKKKIKDLVTQDHYIGSYTVGECALDNPDIYLADGTLDTFTYELYPYTFLANYVTQEENNNLSNLKGKCLTDDKYSRAGIVLYNTYDEVCVNPKMSETFTEWETAKYRIGNTLNTFLN